MCRPVNAGVPELRSAADARKIAWPCIEEDAGHCQVDPVVTLLPPKHSGIASPLSASSSCSGFLRPAQFSMCTGMLKLDGMTMSDAALAEVARRLLAAQPDTIAWLETDTTLHGRGSWRSLAELLAEAGYASFLDGGCDDEHGLPTPAVQTGSRKTERGTTPRYTALLLAVRSELGHECSASPEIECQAGGGGGSAKGVLQRSLMVRGAAVVVLGTSFSPKDRVKEDQVLRMQRSVNCKQVMLSLLDDVQRDRHMRAAGEIQRHWRGLRIRRGLFSLRRAIRGARRYTFVSIGDHNTRLKARAEWVAPPPNENRLTADAVEELLQLLSSDAGRLELAGLSAQLTHSAYGGQAQLLKSFYGQIQWWSDCGGPVPMPSYKRTPYHQSFPALAAPEGAGNSDLAAQPQVITSAELLERARAHGDPRLIAEVGALLAAEASGFAGADPALLKREFFGMRDHVPKSKVMADEAQTFLNEDGDERPVYLQLGWLDSVCFGIGRFSNFRRQAFRQYATVPEVHGFDHLLTVGVLDFEP